MNKITGIIKDLLLSLIISLIFSAVVAFYQPKPWVNAWFATSLLLWLSIFLCMRTWRGFDSSKVLAAMMIVAFMLRIVLGIFLHSALPVLGFDNEVQNSGFVYSDAYNRDTQSFVMASSGESLFTAFSKTQQADQYGGLLFLSALVYRLISPDISRPILITILSTFVMTIGLGFLFTTILQRWGKTTALVAGWFYALYPEGVLLSSSQMREPFLIGLFCIGFWAIANWREKIWKKIIIFILSIGAAALFSLPFGAMICGFLLLFLVVDWLAEQEDRSKQIIGWVGLVLLAGIAGAAGWMWLKPTMYYDAYLTQSSSGTMQWLINALGGNQWLIPFTAITGITQPLLPAALMYPSLPIWMTIMSVRAVGWYFAIPFIIYALFGSWKAEKDRKNWVVVLISISMVIWVCVSTLRAGGDQWDNPRYRAMLIPWLALIVGWSWQRIRNGKGAWFYRWLAIEIVFLLGISAVYLYRYCSIDLGISLYEAAAIILGISIIIIGSGVIVDIVKIRKLKHNLPGSGMKA